VDARNYVYAPTVTRSTFKARKKRTSDCVLERMAVYSVYGYADKTEQDKMRALLKTLKGDIEKQRSIHKFTSILIMGDMNATVSKFLDTNKEVKEGEEDKEEADAYVIKYIEEEIGMTDNFRECHHGKQRVTRSTAGAEREEAERALDYTFSTKEIAGHPATRAGIHTEAPLPGDHHPVFIDIPIDCTQLIEGVEPLWRIRKGEPTIKWKDEPKEEEIEEFNRKIQEAKEGREGSHSLEEDGEFLMKAIREAAIGTIAEEVSLQYPRRTRTTIHREGYGEKLDTWVKRMRGAIRAITGSKNKEVIDKALKRAVWRHEVPEGLVVDRLSNTGSETKEGRKRLKQRYKDQIKAVIKHEKKAKDKEQRERISKAKKERDQAFKDPTGRGKKRVISSLFRIVRESHTLQWVRDEEGELQSKEEQVKKTVKTFFEDWMKQRITVEERWGSWEKMQELDTIELPEKLKRW
jgi:hypothetical protein